MKRSRKKSDRMIDIMDARYIPSTLDRWVMSDQMKETKIGDMLSKSSQGEYRTYILLHYEDMSVQETAHVLGLSPRSVKSLSRKMNNKINMAVLKNVLSKDIRIKVNSYPVQGSPPQGAFYLLYLFLSKKDRVNLLGDLTEEYEEALELFGKRKADIFYYKQVLTTLWPIWNGWITRIGAKLAKWGVFGSLGVWLRNYLTHK